MKTDTKQAALLRKAADSLQEATTNRPDKIWRHKYAEPFFIAAILLEGSDAGNALNLIASHARDDAVSGVEWLATAARWRLLIEAWCVDDQREFANAADDLGRLISRLVLQAQEQANG